MLVKTLRGNVSSGCGIAGDNLAHVVTLILQRTGLRSVVKGTLNITLDAPYIVTPVATIEAAEYNDIETIKLQRCVIGGLRAIIMRPDTHERPPTRGLQLELLSEYHLRSTLNVADGDPIELRSKGVRNGGPPLAELQPGSLLRTRRPDGIESVSRANQAAAFLSISRSSRRTLFSLRSRRSSSRSSVVSPSSRLPSSRSACFAQLRMACARRDLGRRR
jgi:hypothetical protein